MVELAQLILLKRESQSVCVWCFQNANLQLIIGLGWPSFYPPEPGNKKVQNFLLYIVFVKKKDWLAHAACYGIWRLFNHFPYFEQMQILLLMQNNFTVYWVESNY